MLGRLKRTTRLDVGLALCFAGLSYMVWVLVAGVSRAVVQEMIKSTTLEHLTLSKWTKLVGVFFVDKGVIIDVVGLAWMTLSLLLVIFSSRQKLSISWVWVSAMMQSFVAALGAVLVSYTANEPHFSVVTDLENKAGWARVSSLSLQVVTPIALLIWVTILVWLLIDRARYNRRGPTLGDGLRTNVYR